MKTLIVSYIPRGERSHTKKLLDAFTEKVKDFEHLDLTKDVPDFFLQGNLMSYINRNYLGKDLNDDEKKSLAKMDMMAAQIKNADIVVLAYPMYNFSLPAIVKAWFDSILLKGETWDLGDKGYSGLLKGKKALTLMASGGIYDGDSKSWDHATPLTELLFKFMGFEEIKNVKVAGINMTPDKVEDLEKKGQEKVRKIVNVWYK